MREMREGPSPEDMNFSASTESKGAGAEHEDKGREAAKERVKVAMDTAVEGLTADATALGLDMEGAGTTVRRIDDTAQSDADREVGVTAMYSVTFSEVPGVDRVGSPTVGAVASVTENELGELRTGVEYGLFPSGPKADTLQGAIDIYKEKYGKE